MTGRQASKLPVGATVRRKDADEILVVERVLFAAERDGTTTVIALGGIELKPWEIVRADLQRGWPRR